MHKDLIILYSGEEVSVQQPAMWEEKPDFLVFVNF